MQALWMVLGSFWFASMALGIKFASQSFTTTELVFYRGFISLLIMAAVIRWRRIPLRSPVPMMHVGRSISGIASLMLWFYAIAHLPLATAMTLNYMSSIWVATFLIGGAWLYGRKTQQAPLIGTVALGFAGVVLTLQPTIASNQLFAGVMGLLSGMGAALAYTQISALGHAGEPEERILFYFALGTTLVGAIGMLVTERTPWAQVRWQDAAWLVPIGVLASLGQWCLTRAYQQGANLVVASLQYTGIVFSVLYSLIFFDAHLDPLSWLGMSLIVVSGILATLLRARVLRRAPAEPH